LSVGTLHEYAVRGCDTVLQSTYFIIFKNLGYIILKQSEHCFDLTMLNQNNLLTVSVM